MPIKSIVYSLLSKFPYSLYNNNLRVLAYHTVPESEKFKTQLLFLKKHYHIISIIDLKESLFHKKTLPKRSVLITFDDGDFSVYDKGLPLLKQLNIPSVLFIITGLINTEKTFWCRWVENVLQEQGLSYKESRTKVRELKELPNFKRKEYLESLPEWKSKQFTDKELYECEEAGMFIANHTHTHPMIDNCTEKEIIQELHSAKQTFSSLGLDGYSIFAYPNGNYTEASEKILIDQEVRMAFLFDHKINNKNINPLRISRIMVDTNLEINEFKVRVSGLHKKLLNTKRLISK